MWRGRAGAVVLVVVAVLLAWPGWAARADRLPGRTPSLPCDLYAAGGTPCVAAHSLTRALVSGYRGPLYRVRREVDGASADVPLIAPGGTPWGYADAGFQDRFCRRSACTVTVIFDQSGRGNDLTVEAAGGNGAADVGVPADALPVRVGGHPVYGAFFSGGMGYRDKATSGVAVAGGAEGMYMVTSGTHVNDRCCFDYGNAEVTNYDTGNGHMDALNFGTECWFPPCAGTGPWVAADLENGLFRSGAGARVDESDSGRSAPFVTAMLKNDGRTSFAIKDGDARAGPLTTRWAGPLPADRPGYRPMQQEGAIVLGTGGDNSNGSIGSFFEGAMTAGYPSDATEAAVASAVVEAGYRDRWPGPHPRTGR